VSPLRGTRATVFALATTALAAVGHAAAGGGVPSGGALALATAVVWVAAHAQTRRERRLPALLAGVCATQVGLHVAFLGHHGAGDPSVGMVLAHVGAAACLAVWLRRGEALLHTAAARLLRRAATALLPPPVPVPVTRGGVLPATARVVVPLPGALRTVVRRRGPPPRRATAPH